MFHRFSVLAFPLSKPDLRSYCGHKRISREISEKFQIVGEVRVTEIDQISAKKLFVLVVPFAPVHSEGFTKYLLFLRRKLSVKALFTSC